MISFYIYENKRPVIKSTKRRILRQISVFLFILFLSGNIHAQIQFEIREKIIPLRSTRSDVEKITKFVENSGNFIRYETDNEFIDVTYSRERCVGHGWNVPENTVLEFRSYPKSDLMLENILKTNQNLFEYIGHTASYFINSQTGIVYAVESYNREKVDRLIFYPVPFDAELRCKGFPEFNLISSYYSPYERFNTENKQNWHVSMIYDTLHQIIQDPELKGYIFVYCRSGERAKCQKTKREVEKYIARIKKVNPDQVIVMLGGTRSRGDIETFLIPKNDPPPVATPTLPY